LSTLKRSDRARCVRPDGRDRRLSPSNPPAPPPSSALSAIFGVVHRELLRLGTGERVPRPPLPPPPTLPLPLPPTPLVPLPPLPVVLPPVLMPRVDASFKDEEVEPPSCRVELERLGLRDPY